MNYRTPFYAAVITIVIGICAGIFAVNRLGGWKYTAHRLHTLEAWPTYTQRLSQLKMLPIDSGAVVFLGDSHAAFGEWQEWLPQNKVANRGIPGEGIGGLLAFAKTQNLSLARLIVVQVGTNDLLFHEPDAVIERYRLLVEVLQNTGVPVLFCTLPGVNNEVRWTGIDPSGVEKLNRYIKSLQQADLLILDLAKALEGQTGVLPKGLTDDGVHLRGEGYARWALEINHYLNRVDSHQ